MAHKRKLQKMQAEAAAVQPSAEENLEQESFSMDPVILLRQNRQIAHRIDEMRTEKRTVEEHLARMEQQQRNYDVHLSTVDQHWLSLDTNLRGLLARVDVGVPADAAPAPPLSGTPPMFLGRMIRKELPPSPIDEAEVSAALQQRCAFTTEILQQLATAVQAKESAVGDPEIRAQLDSWQAKHAAAVEQANASDIKAGRAEQEMIEISKRLASTSDELDAAKRRVKNLTFNLQDMQRELAGAKSSSASAGAAAAAVGSGGSATGAGGSADESQRVQEAEAAQREAEADAAKRRQESEELREQVSKLEQELVQMQQLVTKPEEKAIVATQVYRSLLFAHANLDKAHTKLQDDLQRLQREHEALEAQHKEATSKADAANANARQELIAQVKKVQGELKLCKQQFSEARETLERNAMQPDRSAQVTELNTLVRTLKSELDRVKKDLAQRPRTAETKALQRDLAAKQVAVNKQLKEGESKRTALVEAKKKAEAALVKAQKEAKKKEKSWNEQVRELQIVNDVLQNSGKEQRELTELRAAEKKLAAQVDALKAELAEVVQEKEADAAKAAAAHAEREAADQAAAAKAEAEAKAAQGGDGGRAEMEELKAKLGKLEAQVTIAKEEEEGLLEELDEIGKSFEAMQEQNATLLSQLKEKDDENFRLMSSRVKDSTKQTVMEDAARARDMKLKALEERVEAQAVCLQKTEAAESLAQEQISKLTAELSASHQLAEQCRMQGQLSNEKLVELKVIFDIADKQRGELEKTATASIAEKHLKASLNSTLESECASLKRKYDQIRSTAGGGDEVLEEELRQCKQRLKCHITNEWKDRIIARKGCFHLCSKKCIENLIKTRNRKCPICANPFDNKDVQQIVGLAP